MTVHTILITDASGSMHHLAEDVRGSHNAYLDKLAAASVEGEEVFISLATFNSDVTMIDTAVPLSKATRLGKHNYSPLGNTALLDAIGNTLQVFRANTTLLPGDKVFAFIQTDGEENCSQEFSKADIAKLTAELESQGWVFVFSGTGPADWAERGRGMGYATVTTNSASSDGILRSYSSRGETVVAYIAAAPETQRTFDSATVSGLVQAGIDEPEEPTPAV
jgi:Mg-chelatase subunit ChlD